jgi:hypothetical protein
MFCCYVNVARGGAAERKVSSKGSVLTQKGERSMLTQNCKSYFCCA